MQLETLTYSWRTLDPAQIHFSRYVNGPHTEILDNPPTTLEAVRCNGTLVKSPRVLIPLDELEFMVHCVCVPRGPEHRQWNSNTTCGAYQWDQSHGKPGLVLYKVDGCGNHFLYMEMLEIFDSFQAIQRSVESIVLWDLICSWFKCYTKGKERGTEDTEKKYRQAFVDGRLKKRKRRGTAEYKVWIDAA